jgi:phosphatidylinositol alpha-1,6-mannosyltransferase
MRLVFWQKELSFHQVAHIRSLAERHEVLWVVHEELPAYRQNLGWNVPDAGKSRVIVAPTDAEISRILAEKPEESVHIFAGITTFPTIQEAFQRCLTMTPRMGILTESRDGRGWRGLARMLLCWRERRRAGNRISFILCMGYNGKHSGRRWFRRCGYPDAKLFPYGYFIEPPTSVPMNVSRRLPGRVRLTYLGQFVERKGGDLLLNALGTLRDLDWELKLIGDGPEKACWVELAQQVGVADRVEFLPVMKNEAAMEIVAESDLFVLPSRFDGWGVVVNELLMRGVPVICSDRCGALDLLHDSWRGEVFASGSAASLAAVLRRWIARGPQSAELTERIQTWSRCIEGDIAANYFLDVLAHCYEGGPRPTPPWLMPEMKAPSSLTRASSFITKPFV